MGSGFGSIATAFKTDKKGEPDFRRALKKVFQPP